METKKTEQLNLFQKLLVIQKEILGLGKDKKSFGYDYTTGGKILEHIKPLMNEHGLILKQEVLGFTNERQDYITKNGAKSEILTKVDMRFTWVDTESGETDVNLWGANGQNDWEKGFGSALTYGERYFLLKYFHISTDADDIDNPDRKTSEPIKNQPLKPKQPQQSTPELTKDSKEWDSIVSLIMEKKLVYLSKLENISISDDLKAELENMIEDVKLELLIDSDEWKSLIHYSNEGKLTKIEQVTKKFRMTDEVLAEITKVINEVKEVKKEEATSNTVKADPKDVKRLPALTDEDYEEAKKKSKIEILKILAEHRMTASRRKELTDLANSK